MPTQGENCENFNGPISKSVYNVLINMYTKFGAFIN